MVRIIDKQKIPNDMIFLARVTYAEGFSKASQLNATVQADKSRTIGHYVVGKSNNKSVF